VVDLPGALRDFPTVHSARQIDVGNDCAVFSLVVRQKGDRFLSRRSYGGLEAAVGQSLIYQSLERLVVFRDQDNRKFRHAFPPARCIAVLSRARIRKVPWQNPVSGFVHADQLRPLLFLIGMKLRLLCGCLLDHLIEPINRQSVRDRGRHSPILLDLPIEFDAFFAHDSHRICAS
jgi:hypothetical protein